MVATTSPAEARTAADDAGRPDQDFQRFLAQGRFMIQRSRSSGRFNFPPRLVPIGAPVRARIVTEGQARLLVFEPADAAPRPPGAKP